MMRSARDGRFLYIRNFSPELPYAGHITYRNQSAIMQEWFRLQAEGKLTGPAALWMRTSRPAEELYDTTTDPHQIHNLSAEPAHRATLERLRWKIEGDGGAAEILGINPSTLRTRMRKHGIRRP